jgi:hypothetical protein
MGIIKQGILGGFSGKVGPTTGSSWKGKALLKSRPLTVAYPGTAKQVSQTSSMAAIVAFVKPFVSQWIKPLWDRFASGMSGYNAFVSSNISNWVNGVLTTPEDLVFCRGSLLAQPVATVTESPADSLVVTWDNSAINDPLALLTDIPYCMVLDSNYEYISMRSVGTRDTESITVSCPTGSIISGTYYICLAFKALNGTRVSNVVVFEKVIA